MEKSFAQGSENILKDFEEWFDRVGRSSLKSPGLFNIEHIFHPIDNHYYCLKIDFDSKNLIARLTLWEEKSVYLEAIDLKNDENFINENCFFSNLNELINTVLLFMSKLNDKENSA
ncbi:MULTISPECIES: hypothetical protein [unclassified Lysinibacillus]|uniref:immunity protein TriTu family protein n=1 Tax=unclassified Lysinibacillus TaxID=2636778 RepID=UPI0025560C0D|nr:MULTISPECIES: hypothetical protein [unclassified Lysinibacillus]MDM5247987.1 hypothetical protein [Lysinibacillus sp. G4S2]